MMTIEGLDTLHFECVPSATSNSLQDKEVTAVLIALGSNHQADSHLPQVIEQLAVFGDITVSTPFQNPDFTATAMQSKPDYVNQCVYLCLHQAITLGHLQQLLKSIEGQCGRNRSTEAQQTVKRVTMDIDILLVRLNSNSLSIKCVFNLSNGWIILSDRYPFKIHETLGIRELSSHQMQ
ncbi:2-amino-4-hydroxy-6-hydroxymethyldihydropteridine diphosphokinase [Psychrobacter sp. DM4]|uniref:2-amino-4-hydroxy-6- hydroxymethyldihydropteridine diphosphokinase n=1 Tax=Psychrobacter sp. DM4 TaxID=3440637 RepID=UPI003F50AAAA